MSSLQFFSSNLVWRAVTTSPTKDGPFSVNYNPPPSSFTFLLDLPAKMKLANMRPSFQAVFLAASLASAVVAEPFEECSMAFRHNMAADIPCGSQDAVTRCSFGTGGQKTRDVCQCTLQWEPNAGPQTAGDRDYRGRNRREGFDALTTFFEPVFPSQTSCTYYGY